jgi:broad specificity phosphatase PhoE
VPHTPLMLIRHGTTAANQGHKERGWDNPPLDAQGTREAEALGHSLRDSGLTSLTHSDLTRATQTAHAIGRATGAPLTPNPLLRTWNVGQLTGKDSNATHPELVHYATQAPNEPVPGGESFNTFRSRIFRGVASALAHDPEGLPGVVTHHRAERLLHAWNQAGQPADGGIHLPTFFDAGEKPASADRLLIDPSRLRGGASLQGLISRPHDTDAHKVRPEAGAIR